MRSYASIEKFLGNNVFLEVEYHDIEESKKLKASEKTTGKIPVAPWKFPDTDEAFCEGDVVIVEHDGLNISKVFGKDEEEKERRVERLKKLKEALNKDS